MNRALLTIDDISSRNTPAIVDFLLEKEIPAILFATGKNVERYYDEALYAVKSGFIVGNHSYSHPAFSSLTLEEGLAEIQECEAVLDRLYQDAGVERRYRPFRFPYGDKGGKCREELQSFLHTSGFHKVDDTRISWPWWSQNSLNTDVDTFWTFDFEEYRIRRGSDFTRESVWRKMHDAAPESGAALFERDHPHILLLHAHDETEELLPGYYRLFLEHLLENGMVFEKPGFLQMA